jgi:hypothetical protein
VIFYTSMSVRVGGGRPALSLAAMIAAAMLFGPVCSVDDAGLANHQSMDGGAGSGGRAGSTGAAGSAGSAGTRGSGGAAGHAGARGTGGAAGSGGLGAGGVISTGGASGSGGRGTGGASGTGGGATGGTGGGSGAGGIGTGGAGTGGMAGAGGLIGTGGGAGTGGMAGAGGTGGVAGGGGALGSGGMAGGMAGMGGRGGGGGRAPNCKTYPSGASLVTPTDNQLHCYWVHANQIDWNSAETVCENEGGTLATILSPAENMFVLHLANQANLFSGPATLPTVLIGATDGKASDDDSGAGDYAWVTDEPWVYANWHTNRPDGACTGCSTFGCVCDHWASMAADGTWYDRQEATPRPFVCEAIAP